MPDTAGADQCQQTSPGQQHPRPGQLALPADQGRQRHRKIAGRALTHAFRLAANTLEVHWSEIINRHRDCGDGKNLSPRFRAARSGEVLPLAGAQVLALLGRQR